MLTIRDNAELAAVLDLIPLNQNGLHLATHVGLRKKGKWRWTDGSGEYVFGEADNLTWTEKYNGNKCAQMFQNPNGDMKLKGIKCNKKGKKSKRSYICKVKIPEPTYTWISGSATWQ